MGYVYLILQINSSGGETCKIGLTKNNPELRVKQLSTGNGDRLTLLKAYESENYVKVEGFMHRKYKKLKTEAKNEWFELSDDNITTFIDDCKKVDETIQLLKETNPFFK